MLHIIRTDATNSDFIQLVSLLDKELAVRDGEDHAFYAQYNQVDAIRHAVVAYLNDSPVGCGAFKPYAPGMAEVKRMFVQPAVRSQGIASQVLSALEVWARELNYNELILETGQAQPEAIGLYIKSGYVVIPNYGQYEQVENSVCFKKVINASV